MDNPEELTTHDTPYEEKQNKNYTIYVVRHYYIRKQTQITLIRQL